MDYANFQWQLITNLNELSSTSIVYSASKFYIKHSLHSLRHSHASNMLMRDFPVLQLSHRLGHADPSITLSIYADYIEDDKYDINNYIPNIGLKQVN
ncbi:tyrosine-type recombinase/integrase [Gammaproteobacteria bacterium]|nr:tyrosine-type recombinase/integrase [Gammaproteobacteria bacterium]